MLDISFGILIASALKSLRSRKKKKKKKLPLVTKYSVIYLRRPSVSIAIESNGQIELHSANTETAFSSCFAISGNRLLTDVDKDGETKTEYKKDACGRRRTCGYTLSRSKAAARKRNMPSESTRMPSHDRPTGRITRKRIRDGVRVYQNNTHAEVFAGDGERIGTQRRRMVGRIGKNRRLKL